ncbi:MAG: hypothetical protein A3F83_12470 [Candidatus Glassbacteria bacterium RIFCSPLOWO2_12_FULL_58_11]|uniref:DUF3788 domain-containing protein n=1 Tax=Candidatus Glassbacteria bacterium RIFCSPLOWO2_12_FULL_58_11 TaxID=1817867 RepID=A0A1F5Z227_9BACT|nr:MAG: hypothetical protein A3F83_12470 [Candidatus Glassbacteria bacterium RIFCSPLOWO2_12_FULL_58_11]
MEPIFTDKAAEPSDEQLKQQFKTTYPYFKKLLELSSHHKQEWKYYGKKYGWSFKVSNKKRAVFYITPQQGQFQVGLAINEEDKEAILNSSICEQVKKELSSSKKYIEGYPIRQDIKKEEDIELIIQILKLIDRL